MAREGPDTDRDAGALDVSASHGSVAGYPYLEVFGRFWDGMSFLILASKALFDRMVAEEKVLILPVGPRGVVGGSIAALRAEKEKWPDELVLWQSFAHTIVECHGLLDEYLRATFQVLLLSDAVVSGLEPEEGGGVAEGLREIHERVEEESDRFGQLPLWKRLRTLKKRFGLDVKLGRELERAVGRHRWIRNHIVHGTLTKHIAMPDGSIARMNTYPPPPYVPLGIHVVRGAMSVLLAVHKEVDAAVAGFLGIPEDEETTALMDAEIERGRAAWQVDPWEPHPEHLFDADLLETWRPE
jgi:hypothetical protein